MTVINGIEIDNVRSICNEMNQAIENNNPLSPSLHVIIVVSNPCQYAKRFILAREFIKRSHLHTILYVVELAHGSDDFQVTDQNNPRHLRIRTDSSPLWHKENLINLGVSKLLPANWAAMAWVDADIEFENLRWAEDALRILNGSKDIVQLWSHAADMNGRDETMQVFESFGYHHVKKHKFGKSLWHPGFAWAITRRAYEKLGGLYDVSILGSGDHNMAMCLLGHGISSINDATSDGYKNSILEFEKVAKTLRLGYVPGVIRHYWHGSKKDRKYSERWKILVKHQFDPSVHVTKRNGLIVPTNNCPPELLKDIMSYFLERNEDSD